MQFHDFFVLKPLVSWEMKSVYGDLNDAFMHREGLKGSWLKRM